MFDHILVPTDGSAETLQAVGHGIGLAWVYDATVHALYVTDESELSAVPEPEAQERLHADAEEVGRRAIDDVAEAASTFGLSPERELRSGTPHAVILDYVEERGIDLVVMGTHGRSGVGPDLGSTTLRVIRNVGVPTLTVRFREELNGAGGVARKYELSGVLVATDGSDGATAAAERGIDVAAPFDASVYALYVLDTNTYAHGDVPRSIVGLLRESGNAALEEVAEMGRERDVEVETAFRRGVPARELLDYAEENDVDLLTLGAHGRTSEVHLGSTTERVIRTSRRPTLSVR